MAQLFGFEDSYVPPPPPEDDGPTPQTQAPPPPPAAAAEATPVKQEPGSELPLHPPSGRKFYGAIKALVAQEKQPVSAKGVILSLGSPQKKVKVEGTDGSHTPGVLKYVTHTHTHKLHMYMYMYVYTNHQISFLLQTLSEEAALVTIVHGPGTGSDPPAAETGQGADEEVPAFVSNAGQVLTAHPCEGEQADHHC